MVGKMSEQEYMDIYKNLNTIGSNRPTDLNQSSIDYIMSQIDDTDQSVIDVGCGRGYFVEKLMERFPEKKIYGADLLPPLDIPQLHYLQTNIEKIPLSSKSVDVVVCSHVLEHVQDFDKAVEELKRIARKKIIITVPKQRYYYYTLDLHLRFFNREYELAEAMKMDDYEIKNRKGDFVFVGRVT